METIHLISRMPCVALLNLRLFCRQSNPKHFQDEEKSKNAVSKIDHFILFYFYTLRHYIRNRFVYFFHFFTRFNTIKRLELTSFDTVFHFESIMQMIEIFNYLISIFFRLLVCSFVFSLFLYLSKIIKLFSYIKPFSQH